jgi:GGDEF domain-containing protein
VALLVQEEVALTYRIEALASTHDAVRQSGAFDTQAPLVTATMSRESVTLRPLAETQVAVEDLGYYASPPAVDHLAVAPVPQPDSSATTFLLADAPAAADLGTARVRTLLKHFSETIALLYDTNRTPPADDASSEGTSSGGTSSPANNPSSDDSPADGLAADDPEAPSDTPRPRRELIAEEMSAAQSTDDDLSLALVHLNRAESIARRGEEAVASAERLFQARLDQMAPGQRIERFGELTYGVFFHEGTETVEPWVADLESTMAQEQGELEGGVSVGVAVWDEETPEALRSEATKALRKAYETGTSTIVT